MHSKSAAQVMSANLITISPDARLTEALDILIKRNVSLPAGHRCGGTARRGDHRIRHHE